jgi:VanZ family protein
VSDLKSYYIPWAAWVAVLVVFAFVALPEAPQPRALNIDKVRHAAAYALLGALAARALAGAVRRGGTLAFVVAFFTVLLVGTGTEVIQAFVPGRSADIVDLASDLAGGVFGALAYLWAFAGRAAEASNEI